MKKFHTAAVILGVILLGLLIRQVGLRGLWQEMTTLGWGLVPLILIEGVADLFHAKGWQYCLSEPHRSLPFYRIFLIRMAGYSINYLTPTATLGGEVTKGTLLSLDHAGTGAVTGVLIGKLAYTLAQLLFVALGSIFTLWGIGLPTGVWPAMLVSSGLLTSGILAFLLIQRYGKLGVVVRWLAARRVGGRYLDQAAQHVTAVDEALKAFYTQRPLALPAAMFWHVLGLACGIVQSWMFLGLLTDQASLRVAGGIWFLGSWFDFITFAVPLGIGVQEATRVIAFNAVGLGSVMGLAYGVTLRLEQIFWAGFGLVCYGLLLAEKPKGESFMSRGKDIPLAVPALRNEKD